MEIKGEIELSGATSPASRAESPQMALTAAQKRPPASKMAVFGHKYHKHHKNRKNHKYRKARFVRTGLGLIYGRQSPRAEDRRLPRVVSEIRRGWPRADRGRDAGEGVARVHETQSVRTHPRRACDAGLARAFRLGPRGVYRRVAETRRREKGRKGKEEKGRKGEDGSGSGGISISFFLSTSASQRLCG